VPVSEKLHDRGSPAKILIKMLSGGHCGIDLSQTVGAETERPVGASPELESSSVHNR
jgi:hypothetical protein